MEKRRKLLVALLFVLGLVVVVYAAVEKVEVGYPGGLLMLLLGSVFWLLAE